MVNKGKRLTGINPLAYLGVEPLNPPQMDVYQRDPTQTDWQGYNLGSFWLNEISENLWLLVSLEGNIAKWILFATGFGTVTSLKADDGGLAVPLIGVVNVFGDGVAITTRALTNPPHTLNITLNGNVATSYVEDTGVAVPAAGVLNVKGDGVAISTHGAGNTITISLDGNVATSYVEDTGVAIPAAGVLNVIGDGVAIATHGAGNTITISLDGDVATTYHTQAGNAVPAAGVLNVFGDSGVLTTTGAGNTVTVDLTPATDGQVIIGSSIGNPAWAHITSADGTIVITNGHNTIDLKTTYNKDTVPYFLATISNITVANATGDGTVYTPVIYDAISINQGAGYSGATGVFTAPVAGLYQFEATVQYGNIGAAHTSGYIAWEINGTGAGFLGTTLNPFAVSTQGGLSTGFMTLAETLIAKLGIGDTIQVAATVSGGAKTVSIGGAAGVMHFSGYLAKN